MEVIAGIDIGGTKCAVSFIHMNGDEVEFLSKEKRPTDESHPDEMVQSFVNEIAEKLNDHPDWELVSIGISCGGPLDEEKGLILCPPNLPRDIFGGKTQEEKEEFTEESDDMVSPSK